MHGPEFSGRIKFHTRWRNSERITLVLVKRLNRRRGVTDLDNKLGGPGHIAAGMAQPGRSLDVPHSAIDSVGEASVGDTGEFDGKRGVQRKPSGANRHLGRLRHQLVLHLRCCRYAAHCNCKCRLSAESQLHQNRHLVVQICWTKSHSDQEGGLSEGNSCREKYPPTAGGLTSDAGKMRSSSLSLPSP